MTGETILVTGGSGYIGSHVCVELLAAGHNVVIVDNLANSSLSSVDQIRELGGSDVEFHQMDLRDEAALSQLFSETTIDAVIHLAGLKAVGESVSHPLRYYDNNVVGTVKLLTAMQDHDVQKLVFSSSATVYGIPATVPVTERAPLHPINPYGRTKLVVEEMLRDLCAASSGWRVAMLRYFNPVGAHASGLIGEDPIGIPNNLMPFVMQTAAGLHETIRVFGADYDTPDGTGIRDYIHVVDLARGHVDALERLDQLDGCVAVNLGTGQGYSVLEVIAAAGRAVGNDLPYSVVGRREGDAACVYADPSLASELLGWTPTRTLDDMCRDHWAFQRSHTAGGS